jgi:ABC-type antimicrobial peptide transport system permease subunit
METIPFITASQKIKYLEVNLTKDVNEFYKENYKLLKKEIEKNYRMWKDLPCSQISRINIVKMAILPKQSTSFLTKVPNIYNGEKDSLFNKCCWKKLLPICK